MISGTLLLVAYIAGAFLIALLTEPVPETHRIYSAKYRNEYKAHSLLIVAIFLAFLAGAIAAWGKG